MDIIFGGICAVFGGLLGGIASAWYTFRLWQKQEIQRAAYNFIDTLEHMVCVDEFWVGKYEVLRVSD